MRQNIHKDNILAQSPNLFYMHQVPMVVHLITVQRLKKISPGTSEKSLQTDVWLNAVFLKIPLW